MVETIEATAIRLRIPIVGPLGNRLLGHSWRVYGDQLLAAAGVFEHVVAAMRRWSGPAGWRHG